MKLKRIQLKLASMEKNDPITAKKKLISHLKRAGFLFTLVFVLACNTSEEKEAGLNEQDMAAQNLAKTTIPIEGMTCNACAARVKNKLRSLKGIKRVKVSLEKRNAVIYYKKETLKGEQMKAAINELGYKAGNLDSEKSTP